MPWRRKDFCLLTDPQDAAMLGPDDPDKIHDEYILAQIMVVFTGWLSSLCFFHTETHCFGNQGNYPRVVSCPICRSLLVSHPIEQSTSLLRFYGPSRHLDVQSKLQEELARASWNCDVRSLLEPPYLKALVQKSLRSHSTCG